MVQPLTLLYTILDRKGTPFIYLLLINGNLYLRYLFILPQKCTKKKRKNQNTLQNKIGEEVFNRNHRAYNIRFPQLQLVMATHKEKSGKILNFGSKNLYKPSKERLSCKCHYLTPASFTYPV